MGADNLATFDRWQQWREIFAMVPVIVVDRPGWRMKALASKAAQAFAGQRVPEADARALLHAPAPAWTFLTGPLSHLSSTALRNKAKARAPTVAKKTHAPAGVPWRKDKPTADGAAEATPADAARTTPGTGA